jgi:hypothetical protein
MFRRVATTSFAALIVALLFASGASATAGTTVHTTTPFEALGVHPCTYEAILISGEAEAVTATHTDATGATAVGLVSGLSYEINQPSVVEFNIANPDPTAFPFEETAVLTGEWIGQGSIDNFITRNLVHVTVNANGEVTSVVEMNDFACRG